MNDSYKKYIENRLKEGNKKSNQHLCAITAVDYYGAEEDFYLLQFYNSECLLLKCKTSDDSKPKRVGIVSCSKYQHGLNEIYKNENKDLIKKYEEAFYKNTNGIYQYDSYYNGLSSSLSEYKNRVETALNDIQFAHDMPVYVCNTKYYSTKAVAHSLQKKGVKVVLMQEVKENLDIIESKRVLHLQDFNKMYLNTVPVMSVVDCFSPQTMYIPMTEITLDSDFYSGKKWRDLITNTENPECCIINGISCLCVTIKMTIDIFNNVFCSLHLIDGFQKTILLYDALKKKSKEDNIIESNVQKIINSTNKVIYDSSGSIDNIETQTDVKEKLISIQEGEIYTYADLFGSYLIGAEEIQLTDTFMYQYYQINNLKNLIKTAITVNSENGRTQCLKKVHLITRRASICIQEDNKKHSQKQYSQEEGLKQQKNNLDQLKNMLNNENVEFLYTYDDKNHDRKMILSNGWVIILGRGLDIFNKQKSEFSPITCKKTDIQYMSSNKIVSPKKKRRQI